jgi:uncharacterized membrane protein YeaQ/YmgE (transglycosylase-associated protein family)
MSAPVTPADGTPTATTPPPRPRPRRERPGLRPVLLDVVVVGVWFAVAGVLGAFVWSWVTTLPQLTRAGNSGTLPPDQLVKQVGIDGWFFVIAVVGGLLSGLVLLAWRNRDPVLSVVLVVLGAGLASWLMVHVGRALGPDQELAALRQVSEGGHVSMQLQLSAPGVAWVWLVMAAVGALVQLWVLEKEGDASS